MTKPVYRVVQWGTGNVGRAALRQFIENPVFELAGVLVHNPAKSGRDAGEIAGTGPTGISATNDVDEVLALDADCVFYAPKRSDHDMICRLLRSGKNVVTSSSLFHPTDAFRAAFEAVEQACIDGGSSFHGSGIHPGFAGDLLPVVLARVAGRVDQVHVYEVVNFQTEGTAPLDHVDLMGFGIPLDEFADRPNLLGQAVPIFAQSMAVIAEGLGQPIDDVTAEVFTAACLDDIAFPGGSIPAGTLAAQHHQWTATSNGKPLVVYHAVYTMGDEHMPENWQWGRTRYRIVIEGDPATELTLEGTRMPGQPFSHPGYDWTALACVNVIPDLCDARPGVHTHFDLGLVKPRGAVR